MTDTAFFLIKAKFFIFDFLNMFEKERIEEDETDSYLPEDSEEDLKAMSKLLKQDYKSRIINKYEITDRKNALLSDLKEQLARLEEATFKGKFKLN